MRHRDRDGVTGGFHAYRGASLPPSVTRRERLQARCDGVFAVILTLLERGLPARTPGTLAERLSGTTWSVLPDSRPAPGTQGDFLGSVSCTSLSARTGVGLAFAAPAGFLRRPWRNGGTAAAGRSSSPRSFPEFTMSGSPRWPVLPNRPVLRPGKSAHRKYSKPSLGSTMVSC
jgi:hypothetical protein